MTERRQAQRGTLILGSGFAGKLFTRTHLFQLPLVRPKLRVVADWTTALLFRRDIAELACSGHTAPSSETGDSGRPRRPPPGLS